MLCVFALCWVLPSGQLFSQGESWKPGRVLVQPRAGLSAGELSAILAGYGGRTAGVIPQLNLHQVQLPAAANEAAVARALSRNPGIQFAELDVALAPDDTDANDPYYGSAWHLPKIGAPSAWDSSLGENVIVAILDTGVDPNHPDLAGQLVPGWNLYDNNGDTSDVYGHGTKVAGVVAATSNNLMGVTSIAWESSLMPVRISGPDGYAYYSTIAQGITWAADHGARVANVSYAASGSLSVRSAGDYMKSLGGLVTVSAGNYGRYESITPSDALISVAATDGGDVRPSWSSYGEFVDLAAPGVGIWTTTNGGGYGAPSGTSFSSPVVAAVIALLRAVAPSMTPSQLEAALTNTARDLGSSGYDIYYGHGRVNAAAALAEVLGDPVPDTVAPSVSIVSPSGGSVSGLVLVDVSAGDNVGVTLVELYVNGVFAGSDLSSPYQFSWDTTAEPDGPAMLQAFAEDEAGNQGASDPVETVVDNVPDVPDTTPPNVSIVEPSNGAEVSRTVAVVVQAFDDRQLATVSLYIDGQLRRSDSVGFAYSWNTRREAAGPHVLEAIAVDQAGNADSTLVQVTVKGKGKR